MNLFRRKSVIFPCANSSFRRPNRSCASNMRSNLLSNVVRVVSLSHCLIVCGAAIAAEPPTVQWLVDKLQRADRAFFESGKLRLRYARVTSKNMLAKRGNRRCEWLVGRQQHGWYSEARELDPMELPDQTIPAEPTIYILKSGTSLDWTQYNQSVYIAAQENFNVLHGWQYLAGAGLNPYRQVIESVGKSYDDASRESNSMLHQFLRMPLIPDFLAANASHYSVHAPSPSDGAEITKSCWVVEWPDMDKIWVDGARGFAVRRRIFQWRAAGPRAREIDNSDFREIKPGLWFPFRQAVVSYADPEFDNESALNTVINESMYEVSELDFSRSPEKLANLRLPEGTRVSDSVRSVKYTVTSNEGDPFAGPLGQATELLPRKDRKALVFFGAGVVIIAVVAVSYAARRAWGRMTIIVIMCAMPSAAGAADTPVADDKGNWSWKPMWLDRAACGPNSLFVLLRLLGEDVTLDEVKRHVECDPVRGCSMASMVDAAAAIGVPTEVLFVPPAELPRLPFPYVLHGNSGLKQKTGHFIVVVARDDVKGTVATIDPVRESFGWRPESGILSGYSGYVLAPRRSVTNKTVVLLALGIAMVFLALVWRLRVKPSDDSGLGGASDES